MTEEKKPIYCENDCWVEPGATDENYTVCTMKNDERLELITIDNTAEKPLGKAIAMCCYFSNHIIDENHRLLEEQLLDIWSKSDIVTIYKYKNRIYEYRGSTLSGYELFYDTTYHLFQDVIDTADRNDLYASDCQLPVIDLKNKREQIRNNQDRMKKAYDYGVQINIAEINRLIGYLTDEHNCKTNADLDISNIDRSGVTVNWAIEFEDKYQATLNKAEEEINELGNAFGYCEAIENFTNLKMRDAGWLSYDYENNKDRFWNKQ